MDGKRIGESAVHVRSREGLLEVTLERGFTQADVDTIKCIPDRKWLPKRLVWVLPHTQSVLDAHKQSLGFRLVLAEGLQAVRSRTAGDFAAEARNAAGDLGAQSQHAIEDGAAASRPALGDRAAASQPAVGERAAGSHDATGERAAASQPAVGERAAGSQDTTGGRAAGSQRLVVERAASRSPRLPARQIRRAEHTTMRRNASSTRCVRLSGCGSIRGKRSSRTFRGCSGSSDSTRTSWTFPMA